MRSFSAAILAALLALALGACTPGMQPGGNLAPQRVSAVDVKIAFAPLTGPPQTISNQLAVIVARDAAARGIELADFKERGGASYTLKGYLSAVEDDGGTLLVYVWDVLSPELKRVDRFSGKVRVEATAADGWSVVDEKALSSLSAETLDQLAAWLSSG